MDKNSKILFFILFYLIAVIALVAFYKFFVFKDYYIEFEVACNPGKEECLVYECNPAEDEECPNDPNERVYYYNLVEKKAGEIPLCDPNNEDCSVAD